MKIGNPSNIQDLIKKNLKNFPKLSKSILEFSSESFLQQLNKIKHSRAVQEQENKKQKKKLKN